MSFYERKQQYADFNFSEFLSSVSRDDVGKVLEKERLRERDFLTLLSPVAADFLEAMAQRAQRMTRQHFGNVVFLYTPLYLANHCVNECVYCGFKQSNEVARKKLTHDELRKEAQAIAKTGLKHILVLTGESRIATPPEYIAECVRILSDYFTSISIEVYPLDEAEYAMLVQSGVDGITLYQETYDEARYRELHKGPKADYRYRVDAPERAGRARLRTINIGALLGLSEWREEAFFTGLHADHLQTLFLDSEVSVSLPRIQPEVGGFQAAYPVDDTSLVQIMLAMRLYMPRAGITVSTRERAEFRDNLIGLGVTRMSAGSRTEVGGYSDSVKSEGQFSIADTRSVAEVSTMIYAKNYQPVYKDWQTV